MGTDIIEQKNFLKIYRYNKLYRNEHRRHNRALKFQIVILLFTILIAVVNYYFNSNFVHDLYLDQFNRIYAVLVALLTAILIGLTPVDHLNKMQALQYDYISITYKQDYVSILMYALMLYLIGVFMNILYGICLQYIGLYGIDFSFWILHVFLLLDSLFFTVYYINELADIIKRLK